MDARLRLERFNVQKLFGEFDHNVPLNQMLGVTALIGPNGMGKTVCLRLINALFRRKWSVFATTQFSEVTYYLSDGRRIVASPVGKTESSTEVSDALGVLFRTYDADGKQLDAWSPRASEEKALGPGRVEHYLPFLTRTGSRAWMDDNTRQIYSYQEVIETFSSSLPSAVLASLGMTASTVIEEIITQVDCHLIETQRLLVFQNDEFRRGSQSTLAISQKANLLQSIIERELGRYAATSQSLDRSFPRRVLLLDTESERVADLDASLKALDTMRSGLSEAGLLVSEAEDDIPSVIPSNNAIARVLEVYVDDTRSKLQVLTALRAKVLLFKRLIDNRFSPKYVSVNAATGFQVFREGDIVPLEKLSSGEQHQLVLFFELLFELRGNALILIDEPELSLHVGWQKKFIADLKEIIELNSFDVLLATHSPQLIGEWEDIVVEIGDVDPE